MWIVAILLLGLGLELLAGGARAQQVRDVIEIVDKLAIDGKADFDTAIASRVPGQAVNLWLRREGRQRTASIVSAVELAGGKKALQQLEFPPFPMLDTGGHMALIKSIAFTPDGRQLVSASDDKVIRIWDVETGKTVRTIHGQSAWGDPGKISAMALSPDGKWLAAGAMEWTDDPEIRLYDFATGNLVALLNGEGEPAFSPSGWPTWPARHDKAVIGLAFSPDGRHLISGSGDHTAIIWDVTSRKALYSLKGHRAEIYAVGFTADGARAVTGSLDHELRLWSVESGTLLATMSGHQSEVYSLAVTQDGRIASGDKSGEIRLWDGRTGRFLKTLTRQKTDIRSLSFSLDGEWLLSGTASYGSSYDCHVYDTASGRETVAYRGHDNVVIAAAISPDGHWAATAGGANHEIHIWDLRTGERRKGADGQPLTLGGSGRPVWAVGFSADGRRIGWGNSFRSGWTVNDKGPFEYALALPSGAAPLTGPVAMGELGSPPPALTSHPHPKGEGSWRRAATELNGWSLLHRNGGHYGYDDAFLDIKLGGRVIATIGSCSTESHSDGAYTITTCGQSHGVYTFTPDGETIISGGAGGDLTAYDRQGHRLGGYTGHEGQVMAVGASPDGRYLVSGAADQTVRLWNLKTRELLVTLFRGADGEWVMWTQHGFYTATAAGARLIGWQINRGPEHAAEYVTAAQLRQHLNRPDIVARAIQLASEEEAVRQAHGADFKVADLLTRPVPRLRIVSPEADTSVSGGHAQVTLELEATPDPVKLIRIHVNGRLVASKPSEKDGFKPGRLAFDVPLAEGADTIAVAAENSTGETVASLSLTHNGAGDLDKPGKLYILSIGVDKYPNLPGKDLRYSGADAKAFAEAMEKRASPLHRQVIKRVLVNGGAAEDAPTAANILDAFKTLRQTKENDTVMLFVAGHGINEGPDYQFAPTDAAWGKETLLQQSSVVPWHAFAEALTGANGRRIAFLDTCHSGNAFNRRFLSDGYEANVTFYSSAGVDQEALEDPALGGGHGLFTYALAEGVSGGARDGAGEVRADGLREFLKTRVGQLAAKLRHEQVPQYFRARDAENFVLARP